MKKSLLIIFVVAICHVCYSQDTIVQPRVVTNTEQIVDKYIERVGDAVAALASQIKVPAEHVYGVLVKQGKVIGISSLCAWVFSVLLLVISSAIYRTNKINHPHDDNDWYIACVVTSVVLVIFSSVTFFVTGLPCLINPEYHAIKDILRIVGN